MTRTGILGTGSYVPEKVVTNEMLAQTVATSDEWVRSRTGIRERRIAAEGEACSDLATIAAERALARAQVGPEAIDLIIVATFTPDMIFPATACLVQDRLGCTQAAAFDLSAACSGFVYALAVADSMVQSGQCRHILVVGAETTSKLINWEDRNTCVLFGDGASAVVVGKVPEPYGILGNYLRAEGGKSGCLTVPASGSRIPFSQDVLDKKLQYLQMDGKEVFKFAVRVVKDSVQAVLAQCGVSIEEIDLFIPHQANIRIVDAASDRLGMRQEKMFVNLDRYGNTSAASIPLALDEALAAGKVKEGDLLLFCGFGAGLTYGATILRWGK